MNNIKYWAHCFDTQQKENPEDSVKALNFSNHKLMNQVHEEILSCIDFSIIQKSDRLLDTGCGTGELLCKMISKGEEPQKYQYFATDISRQMVKKARENLNQKLTGGSRFCDFSLMSVDNMGFKNGCFSLILASESLQYTDPYLAILDLISMTKKSGQIIISIPNHNSSHIQKAIQKHNGMFTGLDFEKAMGLIAPRVSSFMAKPLIFADNQEKNPYFSRELEYSLSKGDILQANRFVIHLTV